MALERSDITKSDFPTGRRGYSQDAVDAHLRKIADEVDELRKEAKQARAESVASGASERVRQIVEAAEASAREITAQAEREAKAMRDEAAAEGREHVAKVSKVSADLRERLGDMDTELKLFVEGLASELGGAAAKAAPAAKPKAEPAPVDITDDDVADHAVDATPVEEPDAEPVKEPEPEPEPEPKPEPEPEPVEEPAAKKSSGDADDAEGARLIALNMALNGTPREETDDYLSKNFDLDDREGLLDEVYARVGS